MDLAGSSSLAEMVKQVAEQQNTQASELQRSKAVLAELQTQLQYLEGQRNSIVSERKAMERQMYFCDEAIATTKGQCEDLEAQISTLYVENIKLSYSAETLQEEFQMRLLGNKAYYEKMAAHRDRVGQAESKLPFMVELQEKRAVVEQMMTHKEGLMAAHQNVEEHNTRSQIQDEISCLESEIKVLKEVIGEKKNLLRDEKSRHAVLRKEIELQKKRGEAILKRLQCQVNKLESGIGKFSRWK